MDLLDVFTRFPDQERCIDRLEAIRWPSDAATCPHCGSGHVARKADGRRVGRWNCHACKSSFNVLSGTIFEKTKVPLQKWFFAIALIVNTYHLSKEPTTQAPLTSGAHFCLTGGW